MTTPPQATRRSDAPITKRLSPFDVTVLELCESATSEAEAIQYIQDWQAGHDSKCTRADAKRYIEKARQHAKEIEESQP